VSVVVVVVMVMMVMAMAVAVVFLLCGLRRHARIFFEFLDAFGVDFTRVCASCLDTGMWKKIDDGFKILRGSFW
jgi:hypothetical protein